MGIEIEPPEFCPIHRGVVVEPSLPCELCSGSVFDDHDVRVLEYYAYHRVPDRVSRTQAEALTQLSGRGPRSAKRLPRWLHRLAVWLEDLQRDPHTMIGVAAVIAVASLIVIAVAQQDARNYPSRWDAETTTVLARDTWWTIADGCKGDRRNAIAYLADMSGVDPSDTLTPGQVVYRCKNGG